MDFSKERILRKYSYDPLTGNIIKKKNGKIVISKDRDGYIVVHDYENGRADRMRGARLIWVMHYGDIPENRVIDHKNRIRDDNRLDNLRIATFTENAGNSKRANPEIFTSKYKGVQLDQWGRWRVNIFTNGETKLLGLYDSEEAAAMAYNIAAKEKYGEFAIQNDVFIEDIEKYISIRHRDFLDAERRGLPKHVIRLGTDYAYKNGPKVLCRFKENNLEDALKWVNHYEKTGEQLDLRTDITRYNKFGLHYNIFPCSTGFRASFMVKPRRYHVGTFRTEEEALTALLKKQEEVSRGVFNG